MQGNEAQLNREVALKMFQPANFRHVVAFLGTCEFVQENIIVSIDRTMESMSTQLVLLRGGGDAREQGTVEIERSR